MRGRDVHQGATQPRPEVHGTPVVGSHRDDRFFEGPANRLRDANFRAFRHTQVEIDLVPALGAQKSDFRRSEERQPY